MESKDREFQKAIIRILILMVTGMIVWNLAVSVTNLSNFWCNFCQVSGYGAWRLDAVFKCNRQ